MDGQPTEDKLAVLNNIFGNDLTQSVISNTLRENSNQFDPTVEKLLTLPANKVNPPQPQPQQPMDTKSVDNINRLHTMFGDLTQSVITTVYESNKRDVEGTVDTLLNMTSNEVATGAKREAEVARQEQELRQYEEFKQLQQRLQEQERKATEEVQQRVKEAAKKKEEEEAQRKAQHEKKMQDEHAKALQEQERLLFEFQRKKAAEEQEKKRTTEEQEKVRKAAQEQQEREKKEAEKKEAEKKEAERKEAERKEAERREVERKKREEQERARREAEEASLRAEMLAETKRIEEEKRKLEEKRVTEERLALKKLEEANLELQKQKQMAEAERKILEVRMKGEMQREEEERRRFAENERRLREEQESIKRSWEEKVRKLENERRLEEQMRKEEEAKRAETKRAEEEERARHEADMRKILELERLKLEEQRKRVEEEKKNAEERLKAMELAAKRREEEEEERKKQEEERKKRQEEEKKQQEEERKREEEERIRLLEEENQARERLKEEMSKAAAQEQFAASAIMVPPAENEPKVQISAEADGTEIRGTWTLLAGAFPTPHAWLGLFAKRSINTYTGFEYVSGTSGSFRFKGLTPGHYEVRIFSNKPVTSRIAESTTLLIGPQVLSFVAQIQGEHIMFEYKLDPPSVPTSWDWVGIYEKTQRRNKNYLSSTYGNTSGTISAALPRTPGEYQARLFAAGAKYNEQATIEFTVVDNDNISAQLVDGTIKASWVLMTVETTSSDWIGLFAAGDASNKYLASVYTHAASAGTVDIPLPKDTPAGTYELRLFSNKVGKYTTFKVSNVITIY